MKRILSVEDKKEKCFIFQEGKIYFSRSSERRFFFIMTVIVAVLAILSVIRMH
jgi:hypothetical protein